MREKRKSVSQLADQLSQLPVYAPLREHIRATIDTALGIGRKRIKEELTLRECVEHSLIAEWLEKNGYEVVAKMMRVHMGNDLIDEPTKYVKGSETVDKLLGHVDIDTTKVVRTERPVCPGFGVKPKAAKKREPMKITPMTNEELQEAEEKRNELMKQREVRKAQLANKKKLAEEIEDSDDSSDDDDSSDSSENSTSSDKKDDEKEKEEEDEEKEIPEEPPKKEVAAAKKFQPWGPSTLELVTDEVTSSSSLPPIFSSSSSLFPPLSMAKPSISMKDESAIDALLADDFGGLDLEDLGDLEEMEEEEKAEEEEEKKEEKEEGGKKRMSFHVEPLEISDGESVDELEEFDTGLLSSGRSEFSF